MSRIQWALAALILVATPVAASATHPSQFQRPDAFQQSINSVIGDASFVDRYGVLPPPGLDPDLRVRIHLEFVHELLSARDASAMLPALREARRLNLARLREYIDAGVFPRNRAYRSENRPCFVDDDGRICAVGYLVEQSAGRDVAERINAGFQYAFLPQMQLPELDRWIESSGFSLLELTMIQPCYDPYFNLTVTRGPDLTVTIRGYVYEDCCGMSKVAIDFGDAVWQSPDTKAWWIPVNISHAYAYPGAYVIKASAISVADCGFQIESQTWIVNVGAQALDVSAVKLPGGPPYRIYLATNDLRAECLQSSLVRWASNESPQSANWYWENGVYRTPDRLYQTTGTRTIWVSTQYQANCTSNQSATLAVTVDGTTLPVASTTWGQIKAMYR